MKSHLFLAFACAVAIAAGPVAPRSHFEAGNAALAAGDDAAAERHYSAALEHTDDPGAVAFNLGVLHFNRKEYADAELSFTRSLDDADAPSARRAKALYNRGVCMLHRGGLAQFRAAIDSFERCLRLAPAGDLASDARPNLELAKLLWAEARVNAKDKPKPNEPPPNAPPDPKKPEPKGGNPSQPPDPNGEGPKPGTPSDIDPITGKPKETPRPIETKRTTGGKGNLPVRIDLETWRPKDEAEAREYLAQLGQRLARDRRAAAEVHAAQERADVKDW